MATKLERLKNLRARHRQLTRPQVVAQPDAIDQTLRASGVQQRSETRKRIEKDKQNQEKKQQRSKTVQRASYRNRKRAEREQARQNGQVVLGVDPELMSDAAVDAAIAEEQRNLQANAGRPQFVTTDPVWSFPDETRRALGYYTNEEREQAARLNDFRSNTFLGSVMPNFGRQAAYNNPGAEMDAFRQTGLYMPNAALSGLSYGVPSATQTALQGIRTGWQMAGNLAQRVGSAATQGVKAVVPVVTKPSWLATTAAFTVPQLAYASSDEGSATDLLSWGAAMAGAGALGYFLPKLKGMKKAKETPQATPVSTQYEPDRRLFTWEHPFTWERRQRYALYNERMGKILGEWNKAAGDAAKEKAFIEKYNIRSTEGVPKYTTETVSRPKTQLVPKKELVKVTEMEDVPSSILVGVDGQPLMTKRPKIGTDGKPVVKTEERVVMGDNNKHIMETIEVKDPDGKPVMVTKQVQKPVMGDDGQQVVKYNFINPDDVAYYLKHPYIGEYTSNIPDGSKLVFIGPTPYQQRWAVARNIGRVGLGLGIPGFIIYKATSSSGDKSKGDTQTSSTAVPDSTDRAALRQKMQADSISRARGLIPVLGQTANGSEMVGIVEPGDSSAAPRDTSVTITDYDSKFDQ